MPEPPAPAPQPGPNPTTPPPAPERRPVPEPPAPAPQPGPNPTTPPPSAQPAETSSKPESNDLSDAQKRAIDNVKNGGGTPKAPTPAVTAPSIAGAGG